MKFVAVYLLLHLLIAINEGIVDSHAVVHSTASELRLERQRREVVATENDVCYKAFFVNDLPPTGISLGCGAPKYICQQLVDDTTTYFSSMFDEGAGIPVYSAYVVRSADAAKINPEIRKSLKEKWRSESGISLQADDAMYSHKYFHKGHLLPVGIYSFSMGHAESTFTYTNAVPQYGTFNSGIWCTYEGYIRTYTMNTCASRGGDLYLITGVTMLARFGDDNVQKELKTTDYLKNKIRVPRSMWTVGCCVASGGNVLGNFAVIGNNLRDKGRVKMTELKVKELEAIILKDVQASPSGSSATSTQLFPGNPQCSDISKQIELKDSEPESSDECEMPPKKKPKTESPLRK